MALIEFSSQGHGDPPVVFVHGIGGARSDWKAQVDHLSRSNRTIAVDLRAHGATPGDARDCTIERYAADVVEILRSLDLQPAVLVGHSMGCRVAVEATAKAPSYIRALALIDGAQFPPRFEDMLRMRFAVEGGYEAAIAAIYTFTAHADAAVATALREQAHRLPVEIGRALALDIVRYDTTRLEASLAALRVPVLALQATYVGESERRSLQPGDTSPYLDMMRTLVPNIRIEIVPNVGHFAHVEAAAETNMLLSAFIDDLQDRRGTGLK